MIKPIIIALLLSLTSAAHAIEPDAAAAREILVVRCVQCHGSPSDLAEGGFGNIQDLQSLIDLGYVTPEKPLESDLFLIISDGDMPPEDSINGPMTTTEVQVLHDWIESGAPTTDPDILNLEPADLNMPIPVPPQPRNKSIQLLGRFHPATTHFPIALLLVALLTESLTLIRRSDALKTTTRLCLYLAAPAAIVTTILGLVHEDFGTFTGERYETVELHELLGITVAILATLTLITHEIARKKPNHPPITWLYRLLLATAAGLVGFVGHLGGLVSNGLDYYSL